MTLPAAPSQPAPLLEATGLVVLRGERLVLPGLDLRLGGGEALLLVGANGTGKSTLLRALAGLCPIDAGRLCWNGTDVLADPVAHAARIGFLGHGDALKPGLTVRENLRLASVLGQGSIAASLELFGLETLHRLPARLLSAGQRRRAARARGAPPGTTPWGAPWCSSTPRRRC